MPRFKDDIPRLKRVFFWTLVFGLAAHAYMYFAFAPSHDGLCYLVATDSEVSLQLSNGRFMQPVYWLIRGRIPAPWLIGILSILYQSLAIYFILQVTGIRRRISVILACGIFSTNLTITATTATYIYTLDTYMLAPLLACTGVWLWERFEKWGFLAAVPLLVMTMGLYQANIDVAIGLALLLLIKAVMEGETFPALWRRALRYGLSILAGGICYYLVVKLSLALTHTALSSDYNGLTQLFDDSILSVVKRIPYAYLNFAAFFFSPLRTYNTLAPCLFRLLIVLLGLCMWVRCIRRRPVRGRELAFLLLCMTLLPLGLYFVCVLFTGYTHDLMHFSYFLVYVLLLMPAEPSSVFLQAQEPGTAAPECRIGWPRFCQGAAGVLCACMIFHNIIFANGAYYYKRMIYDASSRYVFSIVETIETQPDYEPGVTPVLFIGEVPFSAAARTITDDAFSQYSLVTGMWNSTAVTYDSTFWGYSTMLLGHPLNTYVPSQQADELRSLSEVRDMPPFPHDGYCKMINGVTVVKLEP